ncbi:amino acid permease [Enterobacter roggenkampii]|uniref:amino acid permease n=1 Tax=Enterobacter roggenkampii TaxID=1812935 RepID=UPI001F0B4C91|nr:AAA family ATPase [Enterobacter roggenkampii]
MNKENTIPCQQWTNKDTIWMMGVYGATVGAGTLFLPVEIGTRGPLIFVLLVLLAVPLSLVPHMLICRVFIHDQHNQDKIDHSLPLFGSFFNVKGRQAIKLFFCIAHYPVTLAYAVSLVNTLNHYINERLHIHVINRVGLTFIVLVILHLVLSKGRDKVVSVMSALALPFAIAILLVAFLQAPSWDIQNLSHAWIETRTTDFLSMLKNLWLTLPLIAFSLCSAPLLPALASWYCMPGRGGEKQSIRVIRCAYSLIYFSIFLFVLSCILSTPFEIFESAKAQNVNVLSVIGEHGHMSAMLYLAPPIAILGMTKSFLGISMPVVETFNVFASDLLKLRRKNEIRCFRQLTLMSMFIITFIVVYYNPDVINMIETICGPLIAVFLFLIPPYLIFTRPAIKSLRSTTTFIVFACGIMIVSALLYIMF